MKQKIIATGLALGIGFFCYGIAMSYFKLDAMDRSLELEKIPKYYDYKGVTHALSDKSHGSGNYTDLIRAANSAGLDFLFITDHNPFHGERVPEQYSNATRVFFGGRYSYIDSVLLVYGGEKEHQFKDFGQSQVLLNDLLSQRNRSPQNMSIFLAHPARSSYAWADEYSIGLDGMEVINLKQIWNRKARTERLHFLFSLSLYPFNSLLSYVNIINFPNEEIQLWEQRMRDKKLVGLVGNESTAKAVLFPTPGGFIKFPSYETTFQIAANHILLDSELTGSLQRDRDKILEAIRQGRLYMSFDVLGDPKGFFVEYHAAGKAATLGQSIAFVAGGVLKVSLPSRPRYPFEIQVYKDAKLYTTSNQHDTEFTINSPGIYRVQVMLKPKMPFLQKSRWLPWILANPIYIDP